MVADKTTPDGKYFPHPSIGEQSTKLADLQVAHFSVL